jgi:acyl-CoA synthetase (NDP forming)
MTADGAPPALSSGLARVPVYEFPEEAARAVALASRYGRWRSTPPGEIVALSDVRPEQAAAVISRALADEKDWLAPSQVAELLACYGLPLIPTYVVADVDAAVATAGKLERPIALKAIAPGLLHKSDVGGVRLGLGSPEAVRSAAAEIESSVAASAQQLDGFLVQPMAGDGPELIVGVVHDPSFGPVLACGAGGTTAEVIKDVSVRITPLTDTDAREMLRSLRTFPLLDGYRGAPRADLEAIEDVLLRVSAMVEAHPEIAELDCNPLIAGADGAVIVDARVRVEATAPAPPLASLSA